MLVTVIHSAILTFHLEVRVCLEGTAPERQSEWPVYLTVTVTQAYCPSNREQVRRSQCYG